MQIAHNKVAFIHYTLRDDAGTVIDTSEGEAPLGYLHGNGNLVPGLEAALEGKAAGDQLKVKVPPAEGYGERDESLVQQVPRKAFKKGLDIKPGMRFSSPSDDSLVPILVTRVERDEITVDRNHPLAGQNLNFEVAVTEVREATEEEIEHGHVHDGDHDHGDHDH